jgi:hypothetical protein
MDCLAQLWIPIVISAVVLFVASFAAWMILPHHRSDFGRLPDEDRFQQYLREARIPAGRYSFPYFGSNQNNPDLQRKMQEGPVGTLNVFGPISMGQNLVWTFVFFLVTSTVLGYLAWSALGGSSPPFLHVLRIVGTAGILTYSCSSIPSDIWFKRPLVTHLVDGIAYGLLTGLIFAYFWPR